MSEERLQRIEDGGPEAVRLHLEATDALRQRVAELETVSGAAAVINLALVANRVTPEDLPAVKALWLALESSDLLLESSRPTGNSAGNSSAGSRGEDG